MVCLPIMLSKFLYEHLKLSWTHTHGTGHPIVERDVDDEADGKCNLHLRKLSQILTIRALTSACL
jgi:hypothetical protein